MTSPLTIATARAAARLLQRLLLVLAVGRLVLPATALAAVDPVDADCGSTCECDAGRPSGESAAAGESAAPADDGSPDDAPHGCLPGCAHCACCPAAPVAVLASLGMSRVAVHTAAPGPPSTPSPPPSQPTRVFRPPRAA